MFHRIQKIHLIGIGGSGMSGIAEVLLKRGYEVSGSDLADGEAVKRLRQLGARISLGHAAENLNDPQVVVVSTAVSLENEEVKKAQALQIPVIPRAEMLTELMRMQYGIAVAGAHGKTTTTSLILAVLQASGADPTAIIGGRVNSIGSNATLGKGDLIIVEADESDGSFLRLTPTLAIITNIDREHLNHYGDMKTLREAFATFANSVPFYGAVIVCNDDPEAKGIMPLLKRRVVSYGIEGEPDLRGEIISRKGAMTTVKVFFEEKSLGELTVPIPGIHNVRNALAAVAVGLECQIPFAKIKSGLATFTGIQRRLEKKGEKNGVLVFDDYGHHPREIIATLSALRDVYEKKRLIVAFQPHRFTRLKDLFDDFAASFADVDELILLPVYAAGEKPIVGADSEALAKAVQKNFAFPTSYFPNKDAALKHLNNKLQEGDILLTLGAGDIWKLGPAWLEN